MFTVNTKVPTPHFITISSIFISQGLLYYYVVFIYLNELGWVTRRFFCQKRTKWILQIITTGWTNKQHLTRQNLFRCDIHLKSAIKNYDLRIIKTLYAGGSILSPPELTKCDQEVKILMKKLNKSNLHTDSTKLYQTFLNPPTNITKLLRSRVDMYKSLVYVSRQLTGYFIELLAISNETDTVKNMADTISKYTPSEQIIN